MGDYCPACSYTFSEYQSETMRLAIYPDQGKNLIYPTLGLMGEAGEFCEKVKKIVRIAPTCSCHPEISDDQAIELAKELGDVLWYVMAAAREIGFTLDEIAQLNVSKLLARKERGTLHGSGDNR